MEKRKKTVPAKKELEKRFSAKDLPAQSSNRGRGEVCQSIHKHLLLLLLQERQRRWRWRVQYNNCSNNNNSNNNTSNSNNDKNQKRSNHRLTQGVATQYPNLTVTAAAKTTTTTKAAAASLHFLAHFFGFVCFSPASACLPNLAGVLGQRVLKTSIKNISAF